jgi:hypothetical protein
MPTSFEAQMKDWSERAKGQLLNIIRQSAQEVIEDAQTPVAQGGRMPVDTGFLRNSLVSGRDGSFGPSDASSYVLALATMELGDVLRFGWSAEYAVHVEYGARGRSGRFFVGVAAARWPEVVNKNARSVA